MGKKNKNKKVKLSNKSVKKLKDIKVKKSLNKIVTQDINDVFLKLQERRYNLDAIMCSIIYLTWLKKADLMSLYLQMLMGSDKMQPVYRQKFIKAFNSLKLKDMPYKQIYGTLEEHLPNKPVVRLIHIKKDNRVMKVKCHSVVDDQSVVHQLKHIYNSIPTWKEVTKKQAKKLVKESV